MAKLQDKFFNRVIEGKLELGDDASEVAEELEKAGAGVKPIYWHTINIKRIESPTVSSYNINVIVLNNNPNPMTLDEFKSLLFSPGFYAVAHNSRLNATPGSATLADEIISIEQLTENTFTANYYNSSGAIATFTLGLSDARFADLGVNKIN